MSKAATDSKLHELLRQASKRLHHELDHHPILTPLLRSDLNQLEYGNALASLHGVHAVAEAWILDCLAQYPLAFDYHCRRKLAALNSDLGSLGRTPIPFRLEFSPGKSVASLIGVLYTLEGATQGGQFIARNLQASSIKNIQLAFFRGYGDLNRQRWLEFLEFADAQCPSGSYGEAVSATVSLFAVIKAHLDSCAASLRQ